MTSEREKVASKRDSVHLNSLLLPTATTTTTITTAVLAVAVVVVNVAVVAASRMFNTARPLLHQHHNNNKYTHTYSHTVSNTHILSLSLTSLSLRKGPASFFPLSPLTQLARRQFYSGHFTRTIPGCFSLSFFFSFPLPLCLLFKARIVSLSQRRAKERGRRKRS